MLRTMPSTLNGTSWYPVASPSKPFAKMAAGSHRSASRPPDAQHCLDFDNWDALACYCLDPEGNVLAFIAPRGMATAVPKVLLRLRKLLALGGRSRRRRNGTSRVRNRTPRAARMGRRDRRSGATCLRRGTFRHADPGTSRRGWLPTGRPADIHPVRIVLNGPRAGLVHLGPHRLTAIR
jgi:hypothetical protein